MTWETNWSSDDRCQSIDSKCNCDDETSKFESEDNVITQKFKEVDKDIKEPFK